MEKIKFKIKLRKIRRFGNKIGKNKKLSVFINEKMEKNEDFKLKKTLISTLFVVILIILINFFWINANKLGLLKLRRYLIKDQERHNKDE